MANLRELLGQVESKQINEACKKKGKKKTKKTSMIESNTEALSAILEMVENDSLSELELENLMESIENIFNSVLLESDDYEDDDYEDDDYEETYYSCNDDDEQGCDWEGSEDELVENEDGDMVCPHCGSSVSEISDEDYEDYEDEIYESKVKVFGIEWDNDEKEVDDDDLDSTVIIEIDLENIDDEYTIEDAIEDKLDSVYGLAHKDWESYTILESKLKEGLVLGKTSMKDRMASKKYGMTAAGKKAKRKSAKKRAKFAAKIDMCSEKGKTFSFKDMTCVRTKKRRGTRKK